MTLDKALKAAGAYKALKYIKDASSDLPVDAREYLLDRLHLEPKNPAATLFSGVGFFGLGLLVGGALGLMFAPMPGSEARHRIREQGMKSFVEKRPVPTPSA